MKASWEWEEADILALVSDQVQESLTLDYKACASLARTESKKMELSKDVSAFANSAGGTIVYGVHEKENLPTGLDAGYDPREISREWIEQVINSGIQQRIDGIRINQIQLKASPGRVLYVVHVPQSVRAPHMASDKRFYKRFNFASVPMEEYEVRDVARRSASPDLKIEMRVERPVVYPLVGIRMFITNMASEPAMHAMIRIFIDVSINILLAEGLTLDRDLAEFVVGGAQKRVQVLHFPWAVPPNLPIWETEWLPVTDKSLQLGYPRGEEMRAIGWQITSPKMNPKVGFYGMAERPDGLLFLPVT